MGGADHALGPQVDEHRHLSERCVTPGLRLPIFLGKTHLGAPSFGRVRSLKEWKIQAGDLGHRLARDRLEVSNHSDGRLDDGEYQRFALRPLPGHELAFLIEVVPHVVELLDDGIDPLLEFRTRQIVVDLLHLGLLSLLDQHRVGHGDERLPQRYGYAKGAERGYESVMSFTFDFRKTIEIAHQCCWRATADEDGHYSFAVAL